MKKRHKILWALVIFFTLFVAGSFFMLPLPGQPAVLLYHFIDTPERSWTEKNVVSEESFERQMAFLKRFGYRVITMEQFYETKTGKRKPGWREVVITFDDGNYTFETKAMPVLKKYGFPATLFLVSDNVKQSSHGSMSEETIEKLLETGLITIGGHSKTHPLLSRTSPEQLKEELEVSKADLEAMFGKPVRFFAYPSGDLNAQVIDAVERAGYDAAFTTVHRKLKGLPEGIHSLVRTKITRSTDLMPVYWGKLSGLYNLLKYLRS